MIHLGKQPFNQKDLLIKKQAIDNSITTLLNVTERCAFVMFKRASHGSIAQFEDV